jgi:uncharacterized protein (DUF983 family)
VPVCNKCGKEIPRATAVYKVVKTGQYASGGAFTRNVGLCPRCAQAQEAAEAKQKKSQLVMLLVLGLIVIAGAVYWFVLRPQ